MPKKKLIEKPQPNVCPSLGFTFIIPCQTKAIALITTVSISSMYIGVNLNTPSRLHENYGRQSMYKHLPPLPTSHLTAFGSGQGRGEGWDVTTRRDLPEAAPNVSPWGRGALEPPGRGAGCKGSPCPGALTQAFAARHRVLLCAQPWAQQVLGSCAAVAGAEPLPRTCARRLPWFGAHPTTSTAPGVQDSALGDTVSRLLQLTALHPRAQHPPARPPGAVCMIKPHRHRNHPALSHDSSFQNSFPSGTKLVQRVIRSSPGSQLHHSKLWDDPSHLH